MTTLRRTASLCRLNTRQHNNDVTKQAEVVENVQQQPATGGSALRSMRTALMRYYIARASTAEDRNTKC